MAKFEFVSRFLNAGLPLPARKTKESAGYDLVAAEDVMIPPYHLLNQRMTGDYRESDVLELSQLITDNHLISFDFSSLTTLPYIRD